MSRMKLAVCLVLGLIATMAASAYAVGGYFNSSEPGCDGSDPNVLFCDDFETKADGSKPGQWYSLNADAANASGGILTKSKGWAGTIYANPIAPAGAVDCSPGITPFGSCAATSGVLDGSVGGRNMADHGFAGGVEVQELWVRWYYKPSPGMKFSGQKVLDANRACGAGGGCGGIFWWGFGYNIGAGGLSSSPDIAFAIGTGNPSGSKICDPTQSGWYGEICRQNVGANQMATPGHWNFYELHVKLNTPGATNGVVEMYVNDCGASGTSCTGTPTLRMRHTQVDFGKTASNGGMGTLWFENWSNSPAGGSIGQEWYDQIKVSKVGPIGYAGSGGTQPPPGMAPSAPTSPQIR